MTEKNIVLGISNIGTKSNMEKMNEKEFEVSVRGFVSELLQKGPLQIRYMNKFVSEKFPIFNDFSSSKKRRALLTILEGGDMENKIVFKKIGWGEWYGTKLGDVSDEEFVRVRDELNASGFADSNSHLDASSSSLKSKKLAKVKAKQKKSMYIDENVLESDDDENDENLIHSEEDEQPFYSYHHRKSSLNYDNTTQKIRPFFKSTNPISKKKSRSWSTNSATSGSKNIRSRRRSSNVAHFIDSTNNSDTDDIFGEHPGKKRESNLKTSKESSIRSTLLSPTPSIPIIANNASQNVISTLHPNNSAPNSIASATSSIISNKYKYNDDMKIDQSLESGSGTDTDEEDWAQIGAETLRKDYYMLNLNELNENNENKAGMEPNPNINNKQPKDDSKAAILLMSLKS